MLLEKLLVFSQTAEDKYTSDLLNEELDFDFETQLINYLKITLHLKTEQLDGVEGVASGYILNNLDMWVNNEKSLFWALDGHSQLLCNLHFVLFNKAYLRNTIKNTKKNTKDIQALFLNRIYCKKNTLENHEFFLKSLQEKFDLIIYSFGSTELDDDDFPDDYTNQLHEAVVEKTLTINNGWIKETEVDLYIWKG